MATYFISDLHLDPSQEKITLGFLSFLENLKDAETLYILGDFFEAWIGDDAENEYSTTIGNALRALSGTGTRIFFMHGNRDFLVGHDWCARTGCELMNDPTVVTINNTPVILMHGDSLCTDDVQYIQVRQMLRNPAWQKDFLSKSIPERIAFAKNARAESKSSQQNKDAEIMDVNQNEVDRSMTETDVNLLIHGHTHRPDTHQWTVNGTERTRIVLGDWGDDGWMIRWDQNASPELISFSL